MAPELDMAMVFGMEAFSPSSATTTTTATTMNSTGSNSYLYGLPQTVESLRIDDLLDFSTQDGIFDATSAVDGHHHHHHHHYLHHSDPYSAAAAAAAAAATAAASAIGNCAWENNNNPSSASLAAFPDDLYIPSEEAAELEWLSKFVEDSFTDVPFPNPCGGGSLGGIPPTTTISNNGIPNPASLGADLYAVPGRARSKRSRGPATATQLAAATTWSSSSPLTPSQLSTSPSSSSSSSSETKQRGGGGGGGKKKELAAAGVAVDGGSNGTAAGGGVRKCTHCSSEKTPQWRTGPLGPKTLCNACGVRYKSGRLVPEYRPAASPTFVLTQHSNSHRKVMELRRQKELLVRHHSHHHHHHQQHSSPHLGAVTMGGAVSSGGNSGATTLPDLLLRDYEVC